MSYFKMYSKLIHILNLSARHGQEILDLVKTVEPIRLSTPLPGDTEDPSQWEAPTSDVRGMVERD